MQEKAARVRQSLAAEIKSSMIRASSKGTRGRLSNTPDMSEEVNGGGGGSGNS